MPEASLREDELPASDASYANSVGGASSIRTPQRFDAILAAVDDIDDERPVSARWGPSPNSGSCRRDRRLRVPEAADNIDGRWVDLCDPELRSESRLLPNEERVIVVSPPTELGAPDTPERAENSESLLAVFIRLRATL